MAKDGTEAYVQQYLGVLGEDVKEQKERIAELDACRKKSKNSKQLFRISCFLCTEPISE